MRALLDHTANELDFSPLAIRGTGVDHLVRRASAHLRIFMSRSIEQPRESPYSVWVHLLSFFQLPDLLGGGVERRIADRIIQSNRQVSISA
jgi:hypothetical protein